MDETFFNNYRMQQKKKQSSQLNQQKNVTNSPTKEEDNDEKYRKIVDDLLLAKKSIDKRFQNIFDETTIDTDVLYRIRHQYQDVMDQLRRLRLQLGQEKFNQYFRTTFAGLYKPCEENLNKIDFTLRQVENLDTGFRR